MITFYGVCLSVHLCVTSSHFSGSHTLLSKLPQETNVPSRAFMAGAASQAGDADSSRAPGLTSGCRGPWMSTVVLYCWCHSDSASVLLYFTLDTPVTLHLSFCLLLVLAIMRICFSNFISIGSSMIVRTSVYWLIITVNNIPGIFAIARSCAYMVHHGQVGIFHMAEVYVHKAQSILTVFSERLAADWDSNGQSIPSDRAITSA